MNLDNIVEFCEKEFPSIIEDLDTANKFKDEKSILYNVELYDLYPSNKILDILNDNEENDRFVYCREALFPPQLANFMSRLRASDYYIYKFDEDKRRVVIVTDYFNPNINKNVDMELVANDYEVEKLFVTPLNFKLLQVGFECLLNLYDPIIYFKRIIYDAISVHCSDVHFSNCLNKKQGRDFYIAYRKFNDYEVQSKFRIDKSLVKSMMEKIVSEKTTGGLVQDLLSSWGVKTSWLNVFGDGTTSLRLTFNHTDNDSYTCVVRIQRIGTITRNIESLGFNDDTTETLKDLSKRRNGVTFITGAVRTGKNTTMTAMVNEIIHDRIKIKEYSSPIETIMPFEQLDYRDNKDVLSDYIELAKKEDIDMVIINEIPHKTVAPAIVDLVNSSIGVMTTLHINRIWHLPYKLKNYLGEEYKDLITQINGVVNQKMFIELCPHCLKQKQHRNLPKRVLSYMDKYNIKTFYESEGCPKCEYTGKRNSVQPLAEYMYFDDEIKAKLLKCDKPYEMEEIIKNFVTEHKTRLEYVVADYVNRGLLSPYDFLALE